MVNLSSLPVLLATEDWIAAETLLREAVQSDGARAAVFFNLAKVLEKQGRTEEREALIKRALEMESGHAQAWFDLGMLRADGGDLRGAEAAFSRAAECRPQDEAAWRQVLRMRVALGRWIGVQEALNHLPQDAETVDAAQQALAALQHAPAQSARD